jgi:hypothetical protein
MTATRSTAVIEPARYVAMIRGRVSSRCIIIATIEWARVAD